MRCGAELVWGEIWRRSRLGGRAGRGPGAAGRGPLRRRPRPGLRVSYGWDRVPAPGEPVAGGSGKAQRLSRALPESSPADFTLLYLGSSWLPRDLRPLLWAARRRGAPVVLNQDGVGYPGWAGTRTEEVNRPLRRALEAADHVLYQSAFCKESADEFLGEPGGGLGDPPQRRRRRRVHAGGASTRRTGRCSSSAVTRRRPTGSSSRSRRSPCSSSYEDVRLLVAGRLVVPAEPLLERLGLRGRVELIGRYAQRDAPDLIRRAHLLLHTKVNDPCPSTVIEAMACGVPVVHPASGGTVELVGDEAGIGVPHPISWERDEPPAPEALAEAVARVLADRERYAAAARRRAVERSRSPRGSTATPSCFARSFRSGGLGRVTADAAAERREVEAGARGIEPGERDERAAEGPYEHARDRARGVAVLAQEVPDAAAVTAADRPSAAPSSVDLVLDGELRVVLDPPAESPARIR